MRIDKIIESKAPVFSVEFFPPKTEEATEQLFATARSLRELAPDFVSVTYGAGGSTREGTVEITKRLKDELGLEAMAHLSCVGETTEGLGATLDRIAESGIENVFALRGDPPRGEDDFVQPEGGLGSAAELAEFISGGWDFTIGGACFPEVHPEAPDLETDLRYLKTKVDAGASLPDHPALLRQPGLLRLRRGRARQAGIEVPILAGVIPVASFAQTKRICDLCDASIPTRLEEAFEAAGGDEEAEFELGVAYASQQCAELLLGGAPGIHFYALNRAPATRAVLGALHAARPWERARAQRPAPARHCATDLNCRRSIMANRREEERERLRQVREQRQSSRAKQSQRRLMLAYVGAGIIGLAGRRRDRRRSSSAPAAVPAARTADAHIEQGSGSTNGIEPDDRTGTPPPPTKVTNLKVAANKADCDLRLHLKDEGHTHIAPGSPTPDYKTNPPTSGSHVEPPFQQADGAYAEMPEQYGQGGVVAAFLILLLKSSVTYCFILSFVRRVAGLSLVPSTL